MDGITVTLTLKAPVHPGVANTIKIAIADAGDRIYDSNLLIAGDSIQCVLVAGDDLIEMHKNDTITKDLLANDHSASGYTLTITQINGINVVAGDVVTLATGEKITLNADGTITLVGGGAIATNTFTYTVSDGHGNTDVAFVEVKSVPCFVRGTRLLTPKGQTAVERLAVGDLVATRDHGNQPIRWIGAREVSGNGRFAPVVIAADTYGDHGELRVSPQHRILIRNAQAELMFGQREVLVKAKHLVNGRSVRIETTAAVVEYFHIMFDQHEIVYSEGLESESFHPGQEILDGLEAETRHEILALFPQLEAISGAGYGPSARPTVTGTEARLMGVAEKQHG